VVFRKIVSALGAIDVSDADAAEALSADRRQLELTLRAKVIAGCNLCPAVRTGAKHRLTQDEIDNRAYAAWHQEYDQHPEPAGHVAALYVAADISDKQNIAGEGGSP
jgi:hypothetical protein